jgi:ketosteroid isomerase-like protein
LDMKHFQIFPLAAILAVSSGALSQTPGKKADETASRSKGGSVADQVSELDRQWLNAARTRHTDYMEQLFADDFLEMHSGGEVVSKARQIEQIKSSKTKIDEIRPDNIELRYVSPNVAMLTDTTTIRGSRDGTEITGKYRVLRVFVKQQGKWRAAGAALTQLPQGQ